jgi:hypothetical protein
MLLLSVPVLVGGMVGSSEIDERSSLEVCARRRNNQLGLGRMLHF